MYRCLDTASFQQLFSVEEYPSLLLRSPQRLFLPHSVKNRLLSFCLEDRPNVVVCEIHVMLVVVPISHWHEAAWQVREIYIYIHIYIYI